MFRTRLGVVGLFSMVIAAFAVVLPGWAVEPAQVDDFEDGTTMGWTEGAPSPNEPVNVPDGGPGGIGDSYLENVSAGGSGAGSRMVMFNTSQWSGDYNTAGVTALRAHMVNLGGIPLSMRVAVEGAGGGRYASTAAVVLPAGGVWYAVMFELNEGAMTVVGGSQTLTSVLDDVTELRVLSSSAPDWQGDAMAATLGMDNLGVEYPIFGDGFESMDTSAWSETLP